MDDDVKIVQTSETDWVIQMTTKRFRDVAIEVTSNTALTKWACGFLIAYYDGRLTESEIIVQAEHLDLIMRAIIAKK